MHVLHHATRVLRSTIFVSGTWLLVSSVVGCTPPQDADSPSRAEAKRAVDELPPLLPPLKKEDLTVGVGPEVKKGDRVRVHYTGTLLDGTKFDSSVDRGVPFEFTVGEGSVIAGWDLGVVGMKRGGKRKLIVPPHLAYGARGQPPKIGPDATLVFQIELLDIL